MKNKSKVLALFISIITFILGVITTLLIIDPDMPATVLSISENIVLFTSFIISFIAFVFSMVTYYSIDSLNSITSMDGNVLENDNYSIAYEEVVDSFKDAKNQQEFTEQLLEGVMPSGKSESCMIYADHLQRIIDYIIWFAYVDLSNEDVERKCDKIIGIIEKEKERYDKLSNGINYLLNENVKLIKYVLGYQKIKNGNNESKFSKLENIRGEMLQNPISKIVYYDYLGLDYRRKAANILSECGNKKEEFGAEHMAAIKNYAYTSEQMRQFECLIERAEMCFEKAYELANNNILWEGYITYNKLRIEIMKYLVNMGMSYEELCMEIDKVICVRENAEFLFYRSESYLDKKFKEETVRAKNIKENFEQINMRPEQPPCIS